MQQPQPKVIQWDPSMIIGVDYLMQIDLSEIQQQAKRGDANTHFSITSGQAYPKLKFKIVGSMKTRLINGQPVNITNIPIQGAPISVQPHKYVGWFSWKQKAIIEDFGGPLPQIKFLNASLGILTVTDVTGSGEANFTLVGGGYANLDLVVGDARTIIPLIVYPVGYNPNAVPAVPTLSLTELRAIAVKNKWVVQYTNNFAAGPWVVDNQHGDKLATGITEQLAIFNAYSAIIYEHN